MEAASGPRMGWRALLFAGALLAGACGWAQAQAPAADSAAAQPEASPPAPAHRPLRAPPAMLGALPPPTDPEVFKGYPDAPPFSVVSRKPDLPLYPCSMCHNLRKTNFKVRKFVVAPPPDGAPHAGVLRHGKGQMWCLDCHYAKDRQWLRTIDGTQVDFDDAPRICGQCHGARYRDWAYGGHGKRVANWTGERELYSCTHCHDPHSPQLAPREPGKPPPVRAGLQPMAATREHAAAPWQTPAQGSDHASPPRP